MARQTRRRFLQTAAVGAALPIAEALSAQPGDPPSADQSLLAIIRQRFKFLTEDQLKAVQRGLQSGLAVGEVLKRTRLGPLDEPATVFVSDVAE